MFVLPTTMTITMVVGFQAAKVSTRYTIPQFSSTTLVEMSVSKETFGSHNTKKDDNLVDSSRNHPPFWIEKSVQVVSSFLLGWTLATSIAMAAVNTDTTATTATTIILDESILVPTVVGVTTMESMSTDMTESSIPTVNEVAIDAMLLNIGTPYSAQCFERSSYLFPI